MSDSSSSNKRETPPSPYSEATVVQTRNSPPPLPAKPSLLSVDTGDKTMVQARSNLNETFDARTVVRSSNTSHPSFPPEMPAPPKAEAPRIPDAPVRVQETPARIPEKIELATGGAVLVRAPESEEPEPKRKSKKESKAESVERAPRAPLDQRSKVAIALLAAVAILAGVFTFSGSDDSGTSDATQANADQSTPTEGSENLASEAGQPGDSKFQQLSGPPATTTAEVLSRFDKASARAQERVEQYSRSGSGF